MSLLKIELSIIGVSVAIVLVSTVDFRSAQVTAKHERDAAERKSDIKPEDRLALTHPLGCGQYIQKCANGRCRVYAVCADLTERK